MHDAPGQFVTPSGPLTIIDHNEAFNTGYAEGDGGVMYDGMSVWGGYGMIYVGNLVHHSLEVPGLHGRGGIYFDGHQQATFNVSLNVMYKAAGRAFLVNGGAANNVTRNLIVNSGVGLFQQNYDLDSWPGQLDDMLRAYDNGTLKRGDVGDYVWRAEQATGATTGWGSLFDTALANRFPTFADMLRVNSTTRGWASCERTDFRGNVFLNNSAHFEFSTRAANGSVVVLYDDAALEHGAGCIDASGTVDAEWAWFPRADSLEFTLTDPPIDTTRAGLRCDEFRKRMPNKATYRAWVRNAFDGVPSHGPLCSQADPSCPRWTYTPEAAAVRAGLRSGRKLLDESVLCPPLQRTNCQGEFASGASARPTARAWCGGPSGLRPLLEAHHVHTTTATRLEYRAAHNERTSSLKCVLFSLPRCAECATTSMACFVERYHWLTQMYIYLITANCFLVFASRVCTASTAVFEKCMPPPIGLCGVSNCSANDRKVVFI
jgi:hypothetical protein